MKTKAQHTEKLHGNYFIYNQFGPNENYRISQKNLIKSPPKTNISNWKVQTILMWMEFIFPLIWMFGVKFYMYEMTIRFKVHNADKIRITYKSECDGSLTNYLFQKGNTYKNLCAMILCQKYIYLKGCCHLMIE